MSLLQTRKCFTRVLSMTALIAMSHLPRGISDWEEGGVMAAAGGGGSSMTTSLPHSKPIRLPALSTLQRLQPPILSIYRQSNAAFCPRLLKSESD